MPEAIKAGESYVALGLQDDQYKAGMDEARSTLDAFGQRVAAWGVKIAAMGAAISAPLVAAMQFWTKSGDELYKLADSSGLSTTELQALQLAADKSGKSVDSLIEKVKKMPNGSEELKRLVKEAEELGIVMGKDDVKAAYRYQTVLKEISAIMGTLRNVIGAAVVPQFKDMAETTKAALKWFVGIVKESRGFIAIAAKLGGYMAAIGTVMIFAGKALGPIGEAIGKVGGLIGTATEWFGKLAGALGFLVTPTGLVIAALVGLGAFLLYITGSGTAALRWLSDCFFTLKDDVESALTGIADAMAAGDLALAGEILWGYLKLEWQRGINFLMNKWDELKNWFFDSAPGYATVWVETVGFIKKAWAEMVGFLSKTWNSWANSGFMEGFTSMIVAPIVAVMTNTDLAEVRANLAQDFEAKRKKAPEFNAQIDADTAARKAEIDANVKKNILDINDKDGRRKRAEKDAKDREAELKASQDKLAGLRDRAAAEHKAKDQEEWKMPDFAKATTATTKTVGTFSSYALGGLGAGGPVEKLVKINEKILQIDERMLQEQRANQMQFIA